jgi:hypothetical protein
MLHSSRAYFRSRETGSAREEIPVRIAATPGASSKRVPSCSKLWFRDNHAPNVFQQTSDDDPAPALGNLACPGVREWTESEASCWCEDRNVLVPESSSEATLWI